MNIAENQLSPYLLAETPQDRERIALEHSALKPNFIQTLNTAMDRYRLFERLHTAKATGKKVKILEIGCGEGLYLHDVAELLEARGLQRQAEFYGLDSDLSAINTAQEFCKFSNPPRPYLNFYFHDVTFPLNHCRELRAHSTFQFDFIYGQMVAIWLPNAREHLLRLYRDNLKPGGLMYLMDYNPVENESGWIAPHRAIAYISRIFDHHVRGLNGGANVALESANWLQAEGAEVAVTSETHRINCESEQNLAFMRNWVDLVRNSGPELVRLGLLTQEEYDIAMEALFRELGVQSRGQQTFIQTMAFKPYGKSVNLN